MHDLIDAYDQLMDDDFGGRVGDSRVALACEMYTIEELRMDRLHDVYSIQIVYEEEEAKEKKKNDNHHCEQQQSLVPDAEFSNTNLSTKPIIPILTHPDDSVSDLKRRLQELYMEEWGLENRRLDRDRLATGWELVNGTDGNTMSYHLFLHSYGVKHNDILHAVIRKYNEEERESAAGAAC